MPGSGERYGVALQRIIAHLDVPQVYLLGHSHGALVAAYHAIHRPAGLAGIVLYEGAPVTGPEHGAEAARRLQEFAAAHAGQPGLNDLLAVFASGRRPQYCTVVDHPYGRSRASVAMRHY
ncbi:alpha/beta fold hydrolase [Nocardia sp. NPDC057668]|uniref:alpha/beta fold hydrolase n=1 Tax=Nocardia sp. NPDC057668 TaxID=3346202 RepID=UPI0036734136